MNNTIKMIKQQSAREVGLDKNIYTNQWDPLEVSNPKKMAKKKIYKKRTNPI
jgi:hypothetical protein